MWRYLQVRTIGRLVARISGPPPNHNADLQQFMHRAIEGRSGFSILQVGAYDGVSNDAVHDLLKKYEHTRGVLLEPQPQPYEALERLWRDQSRVVTLRTALSDRVGERPLYTIGDQYRHQHPFPDQVSSFHRERVEAAFSRYVWRPPADAIRAVSVATLDWRTLMERYGPFDFLAIDTEGYDAEVLDQVDFDDSPPSIILFEHRLLSRAVRSRCERMLKTRGYTLTEVNYLDTLATRHSTPGF